MVGAVQKSLSLKVSLTLAAITLVLTSIAAFIISCAMKPQTLRVPWPDMPPRCAF